MHSHLQHPLELVRRRCLADHSITLLPRLHNPLSRPLPDLLILELRAQDLLHPELAVYHLLDDESVCADAGKGEGVEVWRRVFGWQCGVGAGCDDDFQEEV